MFDELNDDYLSECVQINALAIEQEYLRVAADYALVSRHYAQSVAGLELAKGNLDATRSLMRAEIRADLDAKSPKAVSETRLDHEVAGDPAVVHAHKTVAEAMQHKAYLRGILEAINTKRDMLVSLGATQRQERQAAGMAP